MIGTVKLDGVEQEFDILCMHLEEGALVIHAEAFLGETIEPGTYTVALYGIDGRQITYVKDGLTSGGGNPGNYIRWKIKAYFAETIPCEDKG